MPIDTITIGAGESAWLPKGAKILSIDATNSLTLSSPSGCVDTVVEPKQCIEFNFSLEDIDSDNFDATDGAIINSILIGDISYTINFELMNSAGTLVITNNTGTIDSVPGISNSQLTSTNTASQRTYKLTAQVPSSYVSKILLKLTFNTSRWPQGLLIKPTTCNIIT